MPWLISLAQACLFDYANTNEIKRVEQGMICICWFSSALSSTGYIHDPGNSEIVGRLWTKHIDLLAREIKPKY